VYRLCGVTLCVINGWYSGWDFTCVCGSPFHWKPQVVIFMRLKATVMHHFLCRQLRDIFLETDMKGCSHRRDGKTSRRKLRKERQRKSSYVLDVVQIRDFAVTRALFFRNGYQAMFSMHWSSWSWFVGYVCNINLCFPFCPNSTNVHALSQFLLLIFLSTPFDEAWSQISCNECHMGCPVIEVSSF
jgi:hypothetical protein